MKHHRAILLLSLLSVCSLGLAAYLWFSKETLGAENKALRIRVQHFTEAKVEALAKEEAAQKEATVAVSDQPIPGTNPAPPPADPKAEEFRKKMDDQRQKESDTRFQAKVTLLKTRLNLTPEQETMAAAALQKARDLRKSLRESGKPGEPPDFAKMQQMFRSDSVAADEIRAQLSPEQQLEHDKVRQEERADRAEEQTNRQLGEWQQYLKMSPEQKDAVFQVLSAQALQNDPELQPDAKDWDDVKQRMEAQQAAQRDSLSTVLDETQIKAFDEINEGRRNLFGGGGFGGPGPGFGPPR